MSAATLVITGGSRGIGRATAERAARAGWDVVLTYRADEAAAADVVRACRAYGRQADAVRADVGTEADIEALFRWVDEQERRMQHVGRHAVSLLGRLGSKHD